MSTLKTTNIVHPSATSNNIVLDSSSRVLVGTSTSTNNIRLEQKLAIVHAGAGTYSGAQFTGYSGTDTEAAPLLEFCRSRGTTDGSMTKIESGDRIGLIQFRGADGSSFQDMAFIECRADGATGAGDVPGRLVFSTTADGASSPTERLRISNTGILTSIATYNNTVSNAANAHFGADGVFYRSTSSIKYKTNVQTLEDKYADAILSIRPVWYQSKTGNDNPSWGWWGFIAEEVAAIDPRLVHWKTVEVTYDEKGAAVQSPCEPEPEGVQYDRFVPHLLNLIKRQQQAIETLETKVAALESA